MLVCPSKHAIFQLSASIKKFSLEKSFTWKRFFFIFWLAVYTPCIWHMLAAHIWEAGGLGGQLALPYHTILFTIPYYPYHTIMVPYYNDPAMHWEASLPCDPTFSTLPKVGLNSGRCTIKEGAVVNTGMSFILPIIWIGLVKIISWEKWRYHTFTIFSFLTEKLKALRLFFASVNISWIWLCWRLTTSLTYEIHIMNAQRRPLCLLDLFFGLVWPRAGLIRPFDGWCDLIESLVAKTPPKSEENTDRWQSGTQTKENLQCLNICNKWKLGIWKANVNMEMEKHI